MAIVVLAQYYEPHLEYSDRLEQISRAIGEPTYRATRQNVSPGKSILSTLFQRGADASSLGLIRSMTSRESALNMQSPKGLLIHGEVGRRKTMLLNLLADSLPTRKKTRFHFNMFILEIFRKLEQVRQEDWPHYSVLQKVRTSTLFSLLPGILFSILLLSSSMNFNYRIERPPSYFLHY
jgi:predicted ATPase